MTSQFEPEMFTLAVFDNPYFVKMVSQIYPTELQLNKANPSDTEACFWTSTLAINC